MTDQTGEIAELRAENARLKEELSKYRQQEVREALMQVPEGRKLLLNKAQQEEQFLREQEAAFWASMPTTTEEEEALG
jgi:NADH:ubiquinone oxidoreductase subunit E